MSPSFGQTFVWTAADLAYVWPAGSWGCNEKQLFFQITYKKQCLFYQVLVLIWHMRRFLIFIFSPLNTLYLIRSLKHSDETLYVFLKTQTNASLESGCQELLLLINENISWVFWRLLPCCKLLEILLESALFQSCAD